MNKFCILSTDSNPDYYSLLPLVCHSWRKLGYEPIAMWLADRSITPAFNDVMDARLFLHEEKYGTIEGVKKSTIAQLSRLFAHEWDMIKDDDILITADADMVIASDIFTHDVSQGQIISYGYDLTGRSELPICYVKATAAKWRELMGEFTIPEKAYSDRWEDYWSVDQQLLTQRAHAYGMGRITFADRGNQNKNGLPTGRWDRHDWAHIPDSIIDVHMLRNSWEAQIQVAERLWPGEDHSFITKFREVLEGVEKERLVIHESLKVGAQAELTFIAEGDRFGFLKTAGNWDNHRPLLLLALSLTKGDVYEYGSGEGSTHYLREYCKAHERNFHTYDSNKDWAEKTGAIHVADWEKESQWFGCGLAFVDLAPGEYRWRAIEHLATEADIICIHDTEEGGAGDYKLEKIWHLFKYRLNYNKTGGGAGATLVSNTIDVNRFRGLSLGSYTFDND